MLILTASVITFLMLYHIRRKSSNIVAVSDYSPFNQFGNLPGIYDIFSRKSNFKIWKMLRMLLIKLYLAAIFNKNFMPSRCAI